jgi:TonB family protein
VRRMLLRPSRCLTFLAGSCLSLCSVIHSQQVGESRGVQAISSASYSNTSDGLRQLLDAMLVAAKLDDHTELQLLVRETEIPNYRNWFATTFGRDRSDSWAGSYGKMLRKDQEDFEGLLITLSRMEGEFSAQKLDSVKRYGTLVGPLDEYLADWKEAGAPKGQEPRHIAEFFFIEGKFRWNSTVEYSPFQNTKSSFVVLGKLLKRVPPAYPEEARKKSIQGTVILNVILRTDGSVAVQNVLEGDPILSPAAIEAVRQWRYEPSLINGQPVEIRTKISVVFTLNP